MPEYIIISADSGTFFQADDAYLVDVESLSDEQKHLLDAGSYSEVCAIAKHCGNAVMDYLEAHDLIPLS